MQIHRRAQLLLTAILLLWGGVSRLDRLNCAWYANLLFVHAGKLELGSGRAGFPLSSWIDSRLTWSPDGECCASLHRAKGRLLWLSDNSPAAENPLGVAVRCQPNNLIAQLWLGRVQLSSGRSDQAEKAFYAARAGGYLYRHLRLIELARYVLRREVRAAPSCFRCWLDYGDALTGRFREPAGYSDDSAGAVQPNWPQAVRAYRVALRLRPGSPEALSALALALKRTDADSTEAIRILSKAFERERSQSTRSLWALRIGIWYRESEQFEQATMWQLTAAQLAPDNCSILREIGVTHIARGQAVAAIPYLEKSVALCPEHEYGQVLLRSLREN